MSNDSTPMTRAESTVDLLRWAEERASKHETWLLSASHDAHQRGDDETARSYDASFEQCRGERWGIRQALYVLEHGCLP